MRALKAGCAFVLFVPFVHFVHPAEAAPCKFPQVLIRHLGECVAPRSKLALAYVPVAHFHFAMRPRAAPIPPMRIYTGPPILPDEYPARPVSYSPHRIPLPELDAGTPPIWRICIEHADWCHNEGTHPNDR